MAIIESGAILIARIIMESEIWTNKPAWWTKVWIYMIQKVNFENNEKIKRGTGYFTYQKIYDQCFLHNDFKRHKNIDNLIRWLKQTKQITTHKTTRGFYITICNYDKYQDINNYRNDTEKVNLNDIETTQKRHRNDTITKECNKAKDIDTRKEFFKKEVLTYRGEYTDNLLKAFFIYWSELNPAKTKMRFELEKTWETNLRLIKWLKNEQSNQFKKKSQADINAGGTGKVVY